MSPYFLASDMIMAAGFTVIAILALYRHFKQGMDDPALRHLLPMAIASLATAIGSASRNWYPLMALVEALSMGVLSWVLVYHAPAMMAQPTMADIRLILVRMMRVEDKVGEILDHVTEEEHHSKD